jgi:hypothetical protein
MSKTAALHRGSHYEEEDVMPKRGDIVVERLTGKRAIVIRIEGEEITCRFADGRLDDRFAFELDPAVPLVESLLSLVFSLFGGPPRDRSAIGVNDRARPSLVRAL